MIVCTGVRIYEENCTILTNRTVILINEYYKKKILILMWITESKKNSMIRLTPEPICIEANRLE